MYAVRNLGIMNYPQQPAFEARHTQYTQQSTSEIKNEKGSGTYGVDPAKEQLDQADMGKDSIIQPEGPEHERAREQARTWLEKQGQTIERERSCERDPKTGWTLPQRYYGKPDIITKDYIVECKKGTSDEVWDELGQVEKYLRIIRYLKSEGVKKTLVYWFLNKPDPDSDWKSIIDILEANEVVVMYGDG